MYIILILQRWYMHLRHCIMLFHEINIIALTNFLLQLLYKHIFMCVYVKLFSCVLLFLSSWTVACQDPLVHISFQVRILEWIAIFLLWDSSQPRDQTCISCVSCIGNQILYHQHHLESPMTSCQFVCIYAYPDGMQYTYPDGTHEDPLSF